MEVLQVYRQFIRTSYRKPIESRQNFLKAVRSGFERNRKVSPRDIQTVEYLLRRAKAQLEWLKSPDVTNIQI